MMTLNKLVFDILETVKSNKVNDDVDIDERQIENSINIQRALWIRNEYNKNGRVIDPDVIQNLQCVELEVVDRSACPCTIPVDCSMLRTKQLIPVTIELHNKPAITKIGPVDRLDEFYSFVPYHQVIFSGNGKFNTEAVFAFAYDGRIYFKAKKAKSRMLKYVNIMGVFEDPSEVAAFTACDGTTCFSKDGKYPVKAWMWPMMKEYILKEYITSMQMPEDNSNNAASDERK